MKYFIAKLPIKKIAKQNIINMVASNRVVCSNLNIGRRFARVNNAKFIKKE
jgi:hypothetical protein